MKNGIEISLNEFLDVKKFINKVDKYKEDIDMCQKNYVVSAKSIMGIFCLDLSNTVEVIIRTEDVDVINNFIEDMKEFE